METIFLRIIESLLKRGTGRAITIGLLLACPSVRAQVPDATGQAMATAISHEPGVPGLSVNQGMLEGPGTIYESSFGGTYATATLTQGADPYLSAMASANQDPSLQSGASAAASYLYYFEIVGPSGLVPVNVVLNAEETYGGGVTFALGGGVGGGSIMEGGDIITGREGSFLSDSFPLSKLDFLSANVVYSVGLLATAGAGLGGQASSSAWIDPQFAIEPTFDDIGDYNLVFSPNFYSSNVPDTFPTLGLLVSALAGMLIMRRKFAGAF